MGTTVWAILTGEYPPQPGGVSDHSRLVAQGLAAAGDEVHVWAPHIVVPPDAVDGPRRAESDGVVVHRLPDHFGPRGLVRLGRELDRLPASRRRLLVQYVPHAFGARAMNVPFAAWVAARSRRDQVWTLFHEAVYPLIPGQPLRHDFVALVTRVMVALVARASGRALITTPAWEPHVGPRLRDGVRTEWQPVPSNLPTSAPREAVEAVRRELLGDAAGAGSALIGHFGARVGDMLQDVWPALLLRDDARRGVVVGRGGERSVEAVWARHPSLHGRLVATGGLDPARAAAYLAACDVAVQPYPDGVTCRRGSTMANLALGTAVVTCSGVLTEPLWAQSGGVALAAEATAEAVVAEAERLLADPRERAAVANRGKALYDAHFDIARTIERLRGPRPRA